jgi:hypothetical protein
MPFMSNCIRLSEHISSIDIMVQTVFHFKGMKSNGLVKSRKFEAVKIYLERKAGRVKEVPVCCTGFFRLSGNIIN